MFTFRVLPILSVVFIFLTMPAMAGEPVLLSKYGDWGAYFFREGGKKVCYMASQPVSKKGNYTRRGEPFALITHRPADNTKDVFSYITGYTYKVGSFVKVLIDDQEFSLVPQDGIAWAPDEETDKRLAQAVKDGSKMILVGTSSRGTETTDTISLKGSSRAYKRMSEECGY